jgi:hypothetical protein
MIDIIIHVIVAEKSAWGWACLRGKRMTGGETEHVPNPREAARYIEQLARELKEMAQRTNLAFLAFLLSMVEDEAIATARRLGPPSDAQRDSPATG